MEKIKKLKNTIIFNSDEVKSEGNIILRDNTHKNEKKINISENFDEIIKELK